jgi:hypothetical protein
MLAARMRLVASPPDDTADTVSCLCRACWAERDAKLARSRILRQVEGDKTLVYEIELKTACQCGCRIVRLTVRIP